MGTGRPKGTKRSKVFGGAVFCIFGKSPRVRYRILPQDENGFVKLVWFLPDNNEPYLVGYIETITHRAIHAYIYHGDIKLNAFIQIDNIVIL